MTHRSNPPSSLVFLLALCVVTLLASSPAAQPDPGPTCQLWKVLQNQSRYVFGTVEAECPGDLINCFPFFGHSIPWGNWGVESNLMGSMNSDQFSGWKSLDGHHQWNSCTRQYGVPNCTYYNTSDCRNQESTQGVKSYAWTVATWWSGISCADLSFLDGMVVTSTGNFMDIWELDGCDEDEHVAYVALPDLDAVMSCDGAFCQGFGGWQDAADVSPNVLNAEVRLVAEAYDVQ